MQTQHTQTPHQNICSRILVVETVHCSYVFERFEPILFCVNIFAIKKTCIVSFGRSSSFLMDRDAVKNPLFLPFVCLEVKLIFAWEKVTSALSFMGIKVTSRSSNVNLVDFCIKVIRCN